jgi:hypothetical protein
MHTNLHTENSLSDKIHLSFKLKIDNKIMMETKIFDAEGKYLIFTEGSEADSREAQFFQYAPREHIFTYILRGFTGEGVHLFALRNPQEKDFKVRVGTMTVVRRIQRFPSTRRFWGIYFALTRITNCRYVYGTALA